MEEFAWKVLLVVNSLWEMLDMAPLYPLPIGRQAIYGKHQVGTNVDIDRDPNKN